MSSPSPTLFQRLLAFLRRLFGLFAAPAGSGSSPTRRGREEPLPYRAAHHVLSPGEQMFWKSLYAAVKGQHRIFTKIRLADCVFIPRGPKSRSDFGRISGYHVDFVLADPDTTRPLLVIELDDRSHRRKKQQALDAFKDRVLQAAGIPILRVRARQVYDPNQLRGWIEDHLATVAAWDDK